MGRPVIDLTGKKFGRLTVIERAENKGDKIAWLCLCECGNYVTVAGCYLKNGHVKSCGCMLKERMRKQKYTQKHGEYKSRLYCIYQNMKNRTGNPNNTEYRNYGEKGITICDEWKESYEAFRDWALKNGYRDDLTIDRIDNDGNYCPENCRWIDFVSQQNNKSDNHLLTYNGKTQTIAQWSREIGMGWMTLFGRIKRGWSVEKALTTPVQKQKGND